MTDMRAIWQVQDQVSGLNGSIAELHALEQEILSELNDFLAIVELLAGAGQSVDIAALYDNAKNDLVAGCELARNGYFKQAYSLWRAWYEQVIFGIFFLESPIHSHAWLVVDSLKVEEGPSFRLMLHQLLSTGRDGHPFSAVFSARFARIVAALKISGLPKKRGLIARADAVLTALSQGVHGTYRPRKIDGPAQVEQRISSESLGLLKESLAVVGQLWCCYMTAAFSFSEDEVVSLRGGALSKESPGFDILADSDYSTLDSNRGSEEYFCEFLNRVFSKHIGAL